MVPLLWVRPRLCRARLPVVKALPQMSQAYGLSLLWERMCTDS